MRLCLSSTSVRGRCFGAGSTTVRVRLITSNEFAKLPGLSTRRVIQRDGSAHFKGKPVSGLCLAEGGRRSEERVGYEVGHLGAILHLCSQQLMMVQSWLLNPWDDFVIQTILFMSCSLPTSKRGRWRCISKEGIWHRRSESCLPWMIWLIGFPVRTPRWGILEYTTGQIRMNGPSVRRFSLSLGSDKSQRREVKVR